MKQKFLAALGLLMLGVSPYAAFGQPSLIWENWGQITVPSASYPYAPQIDAITFINHAGASMNISGTSPFTTSDTLNFTNQGTMTGFPGFDFQTYPPAMGQPKMAANFANLFSGPNSGLLSANGSIFYGGPSGIFFSSSLLGNAKIVVRATNIVSSGTFDMSAASLLKLQGKNVDLSRGNLQMANALSSTFFGTNVVFNGINLLFNAGILDGYWAAETATNGHNPAVDYGGTFPFTPLHWVTNRNYQMVMTELTGITPFVMQGPIVNSNRLMQAVFLFNSDPGFQNSVYFTPSGIAVQWQWGSPNWPAPNTKTNYLYLFDNFGEVTNIGVAIDGYINPQSLYPKPTYEPINYSFIQGVPFASQFPGFPEATPGMLPNFFVNGAITNQYSAYEALFTAGTALTTDIAGGAYSNMPGRVEITAENSLDLHQTRISTLNYLLLEATNHFKGSQNAQISTPYADFNLRSTNGSMTISNLIAPFVDHPNGPCELYSARWTNVVTGTLGGTNVTITNSYHVLFVESFFTPLTKPLVSNLKLAVTNSPGSAPKNLVINDVINVSGSLRLDSERITIAQNDDTAFAPAGELHLLTGDIIWPTSTPNLQYLTNWGVLEMQNAVYFGSSRTQPPYNNTVDIPYQAFVNNGFITNQGTLIWSKYFENNALFEAGNGSIILRNCTTANMQNGTFDASQFGQVSIEAGSLFISNHLIAASSSLDFYLTNSVNDGGPGISGVPANQWFVGNGFSLYRKPAAGDLLGTTVFSSAVDYAETLNYWAGEDRGNSASGFSNNCAIGKLVLNGGFNSSFRFIGTGAANGIYIDYLELQGSTVNRDAQGNFTALNIDPNMTIYFAEAAAGGNSIAEKLNGRNGGRLVWVNSYAGAYSSTNILYPDGRTYTFNRPLVTSCNLDSDNDGIVNCSDSTPIFVPGIVQVAINIETNPKPGKRLSWQTVANSMNYLEYKTSANATNWQTMTNFVFGPSNGTASVLDQSSNSTRYYRVRVVPRQP